jgi:hypothetical protein
MRGTLVLAAVAAALFACTAAGCAPKSVVPKFPETGLKLKSELLPEADRLVDGLMFNRVKEIHAWMSPNLRARVSAVDLSATGDRLRSHYGRPIGIVEERTHREGDLLWYSGLWVYGTGKTGTPDRIQRLVLYQFALRNNELERLLIREHMDVRSLKSPARHYTTVTRLHFISDGEWTIAHGGKRRMTNYHHNSPGQRYAYDMVVMQGGRARQGDGASNKDYFCHGKPIYAPADGTISVLIDGIAENKPGNRGTAGGNGVVIDHGFGEFSSLWHMIPGSLTVKQGDKVVKGQQLGQVGNSGRSTGPHIHYHVSAGPGKGRGEVGMQAPFVDLYVDGQWYPRKMPVRGHRIRKGKEKREKRGAEVLLDAGM